MKKTLLLFLSSLICSASFATISGPLTLCVPSQAYFHGDSILASGGTWSSSNPAVATVGSVSSATAMVTSVAFGTATISYTSASGLSTVVVTVGTTAATGAITGPTTVSEGCTIHLSNLTAPIGSWSNASTSAASVDGINPGQHLDVRGVSAGTAVITYFSGCSSTDFTTTTITVTPGSDCISGKVTFPAGSPNVMVQIWLIKYNPTTHILYATDSNKVPLYGDTLHYKFCSVGGTDSFRVKVADMTMYTMALPTYYGPSAYWNTATVINHVGGIDDANVNITMLPGTPTSGPGFISGDVTMGANKGTADPIPAKHMQIFCKDEATGNILKHTYTDDLGRYTFIDLPVGQTYSIYPEEPGYATTPFTSISLTAAAPSMTVARFAQHTLSHTISPGVASVMTTHAGSAYAEVFPNPASDMLHIHLGGMTASTVPVTLSDMTGRTVLTSNIEVKGTDAIQHIDVSSIAQGIYILTVRTGEMSYTTKVEIK